MLGPRRLNSKLRQDQIYQGLRREHMDLIGKSKGYYCLAFDHHDTIVEALEVFQLRDHKSDFALHRCCTETSPLTADSFVGIHPTLRKLIQQPYAGQAPSDGILQCRLTLLLSTLFVYRSFQALQARDYVRAFESHSAAAYLLGYAVANGQIGSAEDPLTAIAKKGAKAKLANDPKQKAKQQVRKDWEEWRQRPHMYANKTKFAREMMKRYEALESQRVIVDWCGQWKREMEEDRG